MKYKLIVITLLFFIKTNFSYALTEEELKQYTYVDFYNFVSSYNINRKTYVNGKFNDKIINITTQTSNVYLNPVEKYITFLEYRGASRNIDVYQKPFLLDWFKLSNSSYEITDYSNAESILADENFGLFYTSTMYSTKGKNYFLITQKAVNDLMEKELKIGDKIKVFIWNLGQNERNMPVFIVVGYEKSPTISKAIQDEIYLKDYLPSLKDDIFNRKYDKVKGNLEILLKKYPNNIDLKLNLCLIYNQTNLIKKAIACYKDVIKKDPRNYDAYYGISVSYYNSRNQDKNRTNLIIENTTKAIEIIQANILRPIGSVAMIMYNSYYLRAMAKIINKDETAIDDLMLIHQSQPALVSKESLDLFKLKLNNKP